MEKQHLLIDGKVIDGKIIEDSMPPSEMLPIEMGTNNDNKTRNANPGRNWKACCLLLMPDFLQYMPPATPEEA